MSVVGHQLRLEVIALLFRECTENKEFGSGQDLFPQGSDILAVVGGSEKDHAEAQKWISMFMKNDTVS